MARPKWQPPFCNYPIEWWPISQQVCDDYNLPEWDCGVMRSSSAQIVDDLRNGRIPQLTAQQLEVLERYRGTESECLYGSGGTAPVEAPPGEPGPTGPVGVPMSPGITRYQSGTAGDGIMSAEIVGGIKVWHMAIVGGIVAVGLLFLVARK